MEQFLDNLHLWKKLKGNDPIFPFIFLKAVYFYSSLNDIPCVAVVEVTGEGTVS